MKDLNVNRWRIREKAVTMVQKKKCEKLCGRLLPLWGVWGGGKGIVSQQVRESGIKAGQTVG